MADKSIPRRSAAFKRSADPTKRSPSARRSLTSQRREQVRQLRPIVEVIDDPCGDLISDLRSDGLQVSDFTGAGHMLAFLRSRHACPEALQAARELWRRLDDDDEE